MIYIQETFVNISKGYICSESEVYKTDFDSVNKLFRALNKEHGKCVSKMYIGEGQHIGYVFQKRQKYDDSKETFLLETWVSFHKEKPTKTFHYMDL